MNGPATNDDDRLHHYLNARAGTIILPPSDPARIVARASRRRHRRRTMTAVAVLAVVTTGGAVLAAQRPGGDPVEVVGVASPGVVDSTLEWTAVEPDTGLGFSRSTVQAGDGALYSLSSAPGSVDDDEFRSDTRAHLYRSGDGTEWAEIDLPDDLWASSLATDGGRLYALGTAPAGGGRQVVLRSTDDGGESWSDQVALPLAFDALQERFPGQLSVEPSFAAGPDGMIVAAAVVRASPDIEALLPDTELSGGFRTTDAGVELLAPPPGCESAGAGDLVCQATELSPPTLPPGRDGRGEVISSYTWDELGVDQELQDHIGGRLYAFVSTAGGSFEPVEIPAPDGDIAMAQLLVADGIYRLVVTTSEVATGNGVTTALRSTDGRAWDTDSFGSTPGYAWTTGRLAGRPAVVVSQPDGRFVLRTAQADGSWSLTDPLAGALPPGGEIWVQQVAVGPLGLAAVVASPGDPGNPDVDERASVIHSPDGVDVSVTPVDEHLDAAGTMTAVGIDVSADAVIVRFDEVGDDDPATPPRQRLLVGTPPT